MHYLGGFGNNLLSLSIVSILFKLQKVQFSCLVGYGSSILGISLGIDTLRCLFL
jgi:hypothetical protein